MLSYLSWTELFPTEKTSLDQVISEIKKAPLVDSLKLLSVIEHFLSSKSIGMEFAQIFLVKKIFNSNANTILATIKAKNINVIFHHQQVLYLIKLFLIHGDLHQPSNNSLNQFLGNLLLKINDLLNEDLQLKEKPSREELIGYIWQNQHGNHFFTQDFGIELGRMYQIFFEKKIDFGISSYLETLKGIDIKKYFTILITIAFYWDYLPQDIETVPPVVLNPKKWFEKATKISFSDIQIVLDLFSTDIYGFRELCDRKDKSLNHQTINFEPFLEKPLLKLEPDLYICLSLQHLTYAATRGIFEVLRRLTADDPEAKQKILKIGSDIFHEYIKDTLSLVYPKDGPFKRLYDGKSSRVEISDAVIDCNDELIFIEVKAKNLLKSDKLNSEFTSIENALKGFLFKEGFTQIDNRITDFRNSKISIGGISSSNIKKYWPILVSCIEDIPSDGVLRELYSNILKSRNMLVAPDISPLTILSLKEFDYLMNHVFNGKTILEILKDWNSTHDKKSKSLNNYLVFDCPLKKKTFPKHLEDSFEAFKRFLVTELGIDDVST